LRRDDNELAVLPLLRDREGTFVLALHLAARPGELDAPAERGAAHRDVERQRRGLELGGIGGTRGAQHLVAQDIGTDETLRADIGRLLALAGLEALLELGAERARFLRKRSLIDPGRALGIEDPVDRAAQALGEARQAVDAARANEGADIDAKLLHLALDQERV